MREDYHPGSLFSNQIVLAKYSDINVYAGTNEPGRISLCSIGFTIIKSIKIR